MRPRHRRMQNALYGEDYAFPGLIAHLAGCRKCQALAGRLEHIDRHFRKSTPPMPKFLLARLIRNSRKYAEELGWL